MTNNTVGHNGRLFHINMVNQILYHNLGLLKWKKYEGTTYELHHEDWP